MNHRRNNAPKGKARHKRRSRRTLRRLRAGSDALHDTMRDGRRRYKAGGAK